MEITKREIVASIIIIAVMLILGLSIGDKLSNYMMDQNSKYYRAIHVNTTELFQYGLDTSVGNAFIYGDLIAEDTVTYPEIGGEYLAVEKVKEEYTMHTRTVTDSKGKSHTETYYTWDEMSRDNKESQKVVFLGIEFKTSQFNIPSGDYITTKYESSDVRNKYYGYEIKSTGTIFSNLSNGNIEQKDVPFFKNMTIEKTLQDLTSDIYIYIFWVVWSLIIALCVYGFYYMDNNWLNN